MPATAVQGLTTLTLLRLFLSIGFAVLASACGLDATNTISHGDTYESALQQAEAARKVGDLDSALPLFGRALQVNPDGYEAQIGLAQLYLSIGATDDAAALFRDVLAKRESDATARRGLASALIAMNELALAERQLDVVLQANSRDYRALNALGIIFDMQGRHSEAQTRYRLGIELQPDNLPLRNNLGLSLAISGEPEAALALLEPIVNRRGADSRERQNLALAYAFANNLEKSLQVSRVDLDESSAQRQLSYFMRLRSLPVSARSAELRHNPRFFPRQ